MKKFFKQLFCKHEWEVNRWHYTHMQYFEKPKQIEIELRCKICGKLIYRYIMKTRDQIEFVQRYKDKQW